MRNGLSVAALSEFAHEVRREPAEAAVSYGVRLAWETATRAGVETLPMRIGTHRVSRSFSWRVDEPRQLLGANQAANPQELLLSGLGACLLVAFVAGATTRGVQLDAVTVEVEGELDLHGFMGLGGGAAVGFPQIRYRLLVASEADRAELDAICAEAIRHSPNAMTLQQGTRLEGELVVLPMIDSQPSAGASAADEHSGS
jgi:uncharacterized OsmC-like protein